MTDVFMAMSGTDVATYMELPTRPAFGGPTFEEWLDTADGRVSIMRQS